jgi:hypothetical protein
LTLHLCGADLGLLVSVICVQTSPSS